MSATVTHLRVAPARQPAIPPMNVHAYVHSILEATNSLLRQGFEILAFQADTASMTPIIWLRDCPRTRNLARNGFANYNRSGSDAFGPFRVGSFDRLGVTVQWLERVPV